jgi:NAD(P)-dependent dehydrogenase (short-subunit alcohol dehydrogenase family)
MRDEVVLITGGSSGIGLAAAHRFVAKGARVWLTARDEARLAAAAAQLGPSAHYLAADVTDPASLDYLVACLRARENRLDVLLNSAGQLHLAAADADAGDLAERLMRVNYLGMARVVSATLPLLRVGSRRSIVNLSSFVGRLVPPFWSAYAASKHAVQAYSHALRQELRPEGFHVGIVLPGPVQSAMTDGLFHTALYPVPFGVPIMQPERVADAIVNCVLRRRSEVTVPAHFAPLLRLASAFPRLVDLFYRPYRRT